MQLQSNLKNLPYIPHTSLPYFLVLVQLLFPLAVAMGKKNEAIQTFNFFGDL